MRRLWRRLRWAKFGPPLQVVHFLVGLFLLVMHLRDQPWGLVLDIVLYLWIFVGAVIAVRNIVEWHGSSGHT